MQAYLHTRYVTNILLPNLFNGPIYSFIWKTIYVLDGEVTFFISLVRNEREKYNETVNTVLEKEIQKIVKEEDLQAYTNQFLEQNRNSFLARVAGIFIIDMHFKFLPAQKKFRFVLKTLLKLYIL